MTCNWRLMNSRPRQNRPWNRFREANNSRLSQITIQIGSSKKAPSVTRYFEGACHGGVARLTPPGTLFHGAALTAGVGRYSRVGAVDGSEWTESGGRPVAGLEACAPG